MVVFENNGLIRERTRVTLGSFVNEYVAERSDEEVERADTSFLIRGGNRESRYDQACFVLCGPRANDRRAFLVRTQGVSVQIRREAGRCERNATSRSGVHPSKSFKESKGGQRIDSNDTREPPFRAPPAGLPSRPPLSQRECVVSYHVKVVYNTPTSISRNGHTTQRLGDTNSKLAFPM
jgi:hypothetical protein